MKNLKSMSEFLNESHNMHPVYKKLENDLKQAKYALKKYGIIDIQLTQKIDEVLSEIENQTK